jgi:hypothetical protein
MGGSEHKISRGFVGDRPSHWQREGGFRRSGPRGLYLRGLKAVRVRLSASAASRRFRFKSRSPARGVGNTELSRARDECAETSALR